jgi:hypothetical protein
MGGSVWNVASSVNKGKLEHRESFVVAEAAWHFAKPQAVLFVKDFLD